MPHISVIAIGDNGLTLLKKVVPAEDYEEAKGRLQNVAEGKRLCFNYKLDLDPLAKTLAGLMYEAPKINRVTAFIQKNPACVEKIDDLDGLRKLAKETRFYLKAIENLIDAASMSFHNCGTVQDAILTLGSFGIEWGRILLSSLDFPKPIMDVFEARNLRTIGGLLEFTRNASLETIGLSEHEIDLVTQSIRDLIRDLCNSIGNGEQEKS